MQEYVSDAIVLSKESRGDLDHTITLFTRYHGKMRVKSKSTKKITSKLSGHLEPGNIIKARVVETGALQVVDALKKGRITADILDLRRLDGMLTEGYPDFGIWNALTSSNFDWSSILKILGWDPAETTCSLCVAKKPFSFYVRSQEFYCAPCSENLSQSELVYL